MTLEGAKLELREVIRSASEGGYYPEERRRIEAALISLRGHARLREHEHIQELERWIDTLGSRQMLRQYRGGSGQVRMWIDGCLDKIGWRAANVGDEAGND